MTTLSLGSDDLRIIGHAINWQLNGPYEHTPPPHLKEEDAEALQLLFNDVCKLNQKCLADSQSIGIEPGETYLCHGGRMTTSQRYFQLMTDAVASFFAELQSSPEELSIVTGLPSAKTSDVLARLQATQTVG